MGHSIVTLRGRYFIARDRTISTWLRLAIHQIDLLPAPRPCLIAARQYWRTHLKRYINGLLATKLEEFIVDTEDMRAFYEVMELAYDRLLSLDGIITKEFLNSLHEISVPKSSKFPQARLHRGYAVDLDTERFLQYGRHFLALLDPNIPSTVSGRVTYNSSVFDVSSLPRPLRRNSREATGAGGDAAIARKERSEE